MPVTPEPRVLRLPSGRLLAWYLLRSRRARLARIRVWPGRVEVLLPLSASERDGELLLLRFADRVLARLAALDQERLRAGPERRSVLLHGQELPVQVEEARPGEKNRVQLDEGGIVVRCATGATWPALVEIWMRHLAVSELVACVRDRGAAMGLSAGKVAVRDQVSRWGSCSGRGTLSFSWRLVMAPPEVLDYVVLHELSHMLVPNHSARFWAVVEQWCPAWRERRAWLHHNGARLTRPFRQERR
jgi:predicted metal-dependent hydrolase